NDRTSRAQKSIATPDLERTFPNPVPCREARNEAGSACISTLSPSLRQKIFGRVSALFSRGCRALCGDFVCVRENLSMRASAHAYTSATGRKARLDADLGCYWSSYSFFHLDAYPFKCKCAMCRRDSKSGVFSGVHDLAQGLHPPQKMIDSTY
ncbi:MAG: hypothetical protein ABIY40_00780, partial [Rhodanobacteraceae bacterium]